MLVLSKDDNNLISKTGASESNITESLFRLIHREDWLEGVDLFQGGRVRAVTQLDQLCSAEVEDLRGRSFEVRLKLHASGKVIQWLECTCPKNRRYSLYCEHLVATLMQMQHDRHSCIEHLDFNTPLAVAGGSSRGRSGAQRGGRGEIAASGALTSSATAEDSSTAMLDHLKDSIVRVSLIGQGPCLQVEMETGLASRSEHELTLDRAGDFVASRIARPKLFHGAAAQLTTSKIPALCAIAVEMSPSGELTLERVIALPYRKSLRIDRTPRRGNTTAEFYLFPKDGSIRTTSCKYIVFRTSALSGCISTKYVFVPKVGYFPLGNQQDAAAWNEYPAKLSLDGDAAAEAIGTCYQAQRRIAPVLVARSAQASKIIRSPQIARIDVFSESNGWFELAPSYVIGKRHIPLTELMSHAQRQRRRFVLIDGNWVEMPRQLIEHTWEMNPKKGSIRVDALGLLRLRAALGDFDEFVGSPGVLAKMNKVSRCSPDFALPDLDHTQLNLRDYQREGFRWCWWLYQTGIHGLLADDMGLGKTHQAMALLASILRNPREVQPEGRKFLIVAPTTVLNHWYEKITEFTPVLKPEIFHGGGRRAALLQLGDSVHTLITSYGILLRDIRQLSKNHWDCVILDEAHYVKNSNTATYRAACRLPSRIRLGLSGTPMENHLGELKSIFDFLVPGYLGSDAYFQHEFITPIAQQDARAEGNLRQLIAPLKLRRTKEQVLNDLPEKIEDMRSCELSPEQASLYRDYLNLKAAPLVEQLTTTAGPVPFLHVFAILQMLKQICDHPALVLPDADYRNYTSGKFELAKELIAEALQSGHKIAIFSQYVKMIQIISSYLSENHIGHVILTGTTRHRGRVIKQFQEDPKTRIFIGSLLAGGIGIDLTAASVVIHYDRWWNASKEAQATDRVHRIGQKNFVQVFKLITKGTLEEKIDRIIRSKQEIFDKFVAREDDVVKNLTRDDLVSILGA